MILIYNIYSIESRYNRAIIILNPIIQGCLHDNCMVYKKLVYKKYIPFNFTY